MPNGPATLQGPRNQPELETIGIVAAGGLALLAFLWSRRKASVPPVTTYTAQGVACDTAGIGNWILMTVAAGHLTSAQVTALQTTYGGNIDLWLAGIGNSKLTAADLIKMTHACVGRPPPPPGSLAIPDGTLVTYDGAGSRGWVISGGQRREIISIHTQGDVFAACGYDLTKLQTKTRDLVLAMPVGADITGPPDCPYGNPPHVAYTAQGRTCNATAIEQWLAATVAVGHLTSAQAALLKTTYAGNIDHWLAGIGNSKLTAADLLKMGHACVAP